VRDSVKTPTWDRNSAEGPDSWCGVSFDGEDDHASIEDFVFRVEFVQRQYQCCLKDEVEDAIGSTCDTAGWIGSPSCVVSSNYPKCR